MITESVAAGIHIKYGRKRKVLYPSFNKVPKDAVGGRKPNPIKLRNASKENCRWDTEHHLDNNNT